MANIAISALPVASSGAGADVLPIVHSGTTKQLSITNLFAAPTAIGSGTPAAGSFTTLSAAPFGSAQPIKIGTFGNYGFLSFNNLINTSTGLGVFGGAAGDPVTLYIGAPPAGAVAVLVGGATVSFTTPTGLAVTGAISATGQISTSLAGVSVLVTNATTTTGANVGTLTNCPHTGNPALYWEVSINETTYAVPCYALS